jgi:predicted kinase
MHVGFGILATEAPVEELRRRIQARSGDASEATVAVLERQLAWFEALVLRPEPLLAENP